MAWTALLLAGLCEIAWALALKHADGFTRLWPSLGTLIALALSFWFMSLALKAVPFGTAYSVWTGIGAVGMALAGIALFGESADPVRLACLALVLAGLIGLKLTAPA
jgi:quaternary ammonium compound-resistance protein SugE